jgi:DNA modification methylase
MDNYLNKILLMDTIEFLLKLPDNSMDCCITDPPYNISGYNDKKEIGWLK